MKHLLILLFCFSLASCLKKEPLKEEVLTENEPKGYIDSLSHTECSQLDKPSNNE